MKRNKQRVSRDAIGRRACHVTIAGLFFGDVTTDFLEGALASVAQAWQSACYVVIELRVWRDRASWEENPLLNQPIVTWRTNPRFQFQFRDSLAEVGLPERSVNM